MRFTVKNFTKFAKKIDEYIHLPLKKEHLRNVFEIQGRWAGNNHYIYYDRREGFYATKR